MDRNRLRLADYDAPPASLPFSTKMANGETYPAAAARVHDAMECMSRHIDDLARELKCFGPLDEDDGPRAA